MSEITCKRCGYKWNYRGTAKRISCSHCKTTITLNPQSDGSVVVATALEAESAPAVSKHEEVYLPLPLADQLNKFLLARLIGIARGEGAKAIRFKINHEGELYVPT